MLQARVYSLPCFFLLFFAFVISTVQATTWEKAGSFPYQVSIIETDDPASDEKPRVAAAIAQPTQFAAPGEEVGVDFGVQFGSDIRVETLRAQKITFTLTYRSSVLALKKD